MARLAMKLGCRLLAAGWLVCIATELLGQSNESRRMVIVVGAPGEPEFATQFQEWAGKWRTAAESAGLQVQSVGLADANEQPAIEPGTEPVEATEAPAARDQLESLLKSVSNQPTTEFWLVLIGHGSYDGKQSKFNLVGPDVSAEEITQWLEPLKPERATILVNCTSSSGGFIPALSGDRRVVLTATRTGSERNFARFGQYLAAAIDDPAGDLDKDGQTSLLESFLVASQRTAEFYRDNARLATEHALLDDNGDRRGTTFDWFSGIRVVRKPQSGELPDGRLAHALHLQVAPQENDWSPEKLARRDELEKQIEQLVADKEQFQVDDYYRQLEALLIPLARLRD